MSWLKYILKRHLVFSMTCDNVLNFGILCKRTNRTAGKKRTMSLEIIDTIYVLRLQNFISYIQMNLIEVTLDSNKIIERLANYKNINIGSWSKIYYLVQM